jgi:hypothetical protein
MIDDPHHAMLGCGCAKVVIRVVHSWWMGATTDGYDGIPYDELPIEAVEVLPDQERHLARQQRTGTPHEVDIEPSWAVEAALDPRALVEDGRSRTGLSIRVIGLSSSCPAADGDPRGSVLVVYLVPATAPPAGSWLVVTAWLAGRHQRRIYWEEPDE